MSGNLSCGCSAPEREGVEGRDQLVLAWDNLCSVSRQKADELNRIRKNSGRFKRFA